MTKSTRLAVIVAALLSFGPATTARCSNNLMVLCLQPVSEYPDYENHTGGAPTMQVLDWASNCAVELDSGPGSTFDIVWNMRMYDEKDDGTGADAIDSDILATRVTLVSNAIWRHYAHGDGNLMGSETVEADALRQVDVRQTIQATDAANTLKQANLDSSWLYEVLKP